MPRTYTPEEKAAALRQLAANNGQVLLTSRQTAIPERTLQRWKSLSQPPQNYLSQPPPPAAMTSFSPPPLTGEAGRGFTDDDEYEALRQRLLKEVLVIADSISDGIHEAPVNQRAVVLARLLDRLVKLDALHPRPVETKFVVAYEPDEQDNPENETLSVYWGLRSDTYGPYPNGMLPGHLEEQLKRDGFADVHLTLDEP